MGFLMPKVSAPDIPPPPPAANPPTIADPAVAAAGNAQRAGAAAAEGQGFDGTVQTSPMGAPAAATAMKSLLGQ